MKDIPKLATLRTALVNYLSSPAFRYLSAFVNTEKHHVIIDASFSLSLSVNAVSSGGLQLESFTYKGATYPKKWASELFESDYSEILAQTIRVGNAVSAYLHVLADLSPPTLVAGATV